MSFDITSDGSCSKDPKDSHYSWQVKLYEQTDFQHHLWGSGNQIGETTKISPGGNVSVDVANIRTGFIEFKRDHVDACKVFFSDLTGKQKQHKLYIDQCGLVKHYHMFQDRRHFSRIECGETIYL